MTFTPRPGTPRDLVTAAMDNPHQLTAGELHYASAGIPSDIAHGSFAIAHGTTMAAGPHWPLMTNTNTGLKL